MFEEVLYGGLFVILFRLLVRLALWGWIHVKLGWLCFVSPCAGGHHAHALSEAGASRDQKSVVDEAVVAGGEHGHAHAHSHEQLHAYIGVSLVLGFVFMLLVDQIGSSHVHTTDGQLSLVLRSNLFTGAIFSSNLKD